MINKTIKQRLILSDGIGTITALVNSNAYEGVKLLKYNVNSVIFIRDFKIDSIKGKKIIILETPFKLLGQHDIIGSPKPVEKLGSSDFNKNIDLTFKEEPKENLSSLSNSNGKHEEEKAKPSIKPVVRTTTKQNKGFVEIMDQEQAETDFTPIAALNTMNQDWKIKARITKKGQVRHWKNFKGEGDLLNIELMDEYGDMIQGTFFNKVVDQFKDQIHENKVYSFEKGYVKQSNSRYSSIKNELWITFSKDTIIKELEDDNKISADGFWYSTLKDISKMDNGKIIDVKGVVIHVEDMDEITMKTGRTKPIRRVLIADNSKEPGLSLQVTFWGNIAYKSNFEYGEIVAFKDAKVGTYNAVSLNMSDEWYFKKLKDQEDLKKWFENLPDIEDIIPLSEQNKNRFKTREAGMKPELLHEVLKKVRDDLEDDSSPTYILECYLVFIAKADNMVYMACPEDKKKVQNDPGREDWYCEKWDKYYDEPIPTYMVDAKLTDGTGSIFASFYADQGEQLFDGFTAKEFSDLQRYGTDQEVKDKIEELLYKQIRVLVKARINNYGRDAGNIKWYGQKVMTYKMQSHNLDLISKLKEMKSQSKDK